jgi:hypothetical protein
MGKEVKRIAALLPQTVQATPFYIPYTANRYVTTPISSLNTLRWT